MSGCFDVLAAFLMLNLAAILAAAALNLPPQARLHALPIAPAGGVPPAFWATAPAVLALTAGALFLRHRRRGPAQPQRAGAALLAWPLLLAGLWSWSGADRPSRADAALLAALAALVVALVLRARARGDTLGCARARLRPALRALAVPTALMIVGAIAWGASQGRRPAPGAVAWSLAGYPLWAALQMLVLLALPWPLLRRNGARGAGAVAGVACLCALAHWPNGPLMLACLVAMVAWARVWARRPSLPAVALAMGLAATALMQLGPVETLEHGRVGPRCARHRLAAMLAAPGAAADTTNIPSLVRGFFGATTGRTPTDAEVAAWSRAVATRLRERIAWQFLTSQELRVRAPELAAPPTERFVTPDEPWRGRIEAWGADAYYRQAGGDDRAFLRALYRDVLARRPDETELDGWAGSFAPSRSQRRALAAALFDARRSASGDARGAAALRLP